LFFSGKIKVDQSHCNYHLADWLLAQGWTVVFTDAGGHSRGGIGARAAALNVFESRGFPIPDIVAHRGQDLILIEIDSNFARVAGSLQRYRDRGQELLTELGSALEIAPSRLLLGFCKTGVSATAPNVASDVCSAVFWFDAARSARSTLA
jgi:hypothetical protein